MPAVSLRDLHSPEAIFLAVLRHTDASSRSRLRTPDSLVYRFISSLTASSLSLSWFAESLRLDWEPKGITVTVVTPGFVDTPLTRKNDFAMPGRVTVDEAVKAIRIGLAAGKMHIAFPAGFGFILRLLSGLPAFLQRTLLRRMVRS